MYYNHIHFPENTFINIEHYHGIDGIGITIDNSTFSIGPLKYDVAYTSDLPEFLEKELLPVGEFHRRKNEAKERRRKAILKSLPKGAAYLESSGVKFRIIQRHPYVIGNHDYTIDRDQAMPIYDSDCMRVGDGFAIEINQLLDVTIDNVLGIYEKDINTRGKFVETGKNRAKLVTYENPPDKHINPVPKNPISKYLMARRLLKEYNDFYPFGKKNPAGFKRRTEKTGEFIAIYNKNENGNYYHFLVPRIMSHMVIEDEMHGDYGPQIEANIVPQLNFPAKDLVNYPMIDFEHPSFFKEYPKGLEGEKMREKEALDFKLGRLPCAAYNYLDRAGIIDEMHRSIDDKYEHIRIAKSSK